MLMNFPRRANRQRYSRQVEHLRERAWHQSVVARTAENRPAKRKRYPTSDVKRVVRAFELLADGTSYAQQKERLAHIEQYVPAVFIGLAVEPDILRTRIRARVDHMVEQA